MKKNTMNCLLSAGLLAIGAFAPACSCGDDDDNNGNNPDASGTDAPSVDADINAFPVLGTQIDRSGRPAISTAAVKSLLFTDKPDQDAFRQQYNQNDDPSTWVAMYAGEIATQLGVLDSLDSNLSAAGVATTGCGNQLLWTDADGYTPLSELLADDRLRINTMQADCTRYLGVELGLANDCGGRTPVMDVIDVSYGALAAGGGSLPLGIPDGAAISANANDDAFPFLEVPITQ